MISSSSVATRDSSNKFGLSSRCTIGPQAFRLVGDLPLCERAFWEYFYDDDGNLTDTIDMVPGGVVLNIEKGQWHSLKSLESGSVLLESKDEKYEPLREGEILY